MDCHFCSLVCFDLCFLCICLGSQYQFISFSFTFSLKNFFVIISFGLNDSGFLSSRSSGYFQARLRLAQQSVSLYLCPPALRFDLLELSLMLPRLFLSLLVFVIVDFVHLRILLPLLQLQLRVILGCSGKRCGKILRKSDRRHFALSEVNSKNCKPLLEFFQNF